MKLAALAIIATVAVPLAAYADSSQPNSAPGLEGKPVTTQGEGTTGMNKGAYPGTSTNGMAPRAGSAAQKRVPHDNANPSTTRTDNLR